ncbi:hypothetical protein KL933_003789 [Ogataea haglerorum]|uniref:Uncharacterized protein n=1 Tax=Ogataea haglerorum TaxID=1937702 RepID=A0AAN6D3Q5_9ASCO|nr:hypothetical protein KL915_002635 [Ogataea haglerorum]KAG7696643.1 hypothetical protein KL951_003099 [Ogataea haglerorum]KAG7708780.1 hypothetical protein KL950_002300 [Ogataea haglerorum]KAG7725741.1 hypothetical protein KL933_003789 [Ogataea haglerorum]KAG7731776.1 hypothetical protein KL948_002709 [Ogataea haglerorum]
MRKDYVLEVRSSDAKCPEVIYQDDRKRTKSTDASEIKPQKYMKFSVRSARQHDGTLALVMQLVLLAAAMGRRLDSPDGANAGVSFLLPGGELGIRLAAGADGREPHNYSKSGRAERVVPRAKKRVRIGASAAKQGFGEIGIKQTWTHGEDAKQTVLPDGGRA